MSVILKCHVYRNANIVSYTCTCNTSFVTTQFTYIVGFRVNMSKCKYLIKLTLRGLSLFLKMFTISNTVVSAAYILATVHFRGSQTWLFFWHGVLHVFFYQLAYWDSKVSKRFVGLIQMQCSPSFDCNWGKQNDSIVHVCWHRTWYFGQRAAKKTINSFSHFHGLMRDNNYKHFEWFVMLGTHFEPHRGQMSHICDIHCIYVFHMSSIC